MVRHRARAVGAAQELRLDISPPPPSTEAGALDGASSIPQGFCQLKRTAAVRPR